MNRAFRPLNLLLILAICFVFQFLALEMRETSLGFFSDFFWPYSIVSILIAAAGYLINGYYDREIDAINHPNYQFPFSKKQSFLIYGLINLLAIIISSFLFSFETLMIFIILPIWILWIYSYLLKRLPLVGNLTIAFISIWLPIGLLFLNNNLSDFEDHSFVSQLTLLILSEIFIITLGRELVKDIQDLDGDQKGNARTLAILIGDKYSAAISSFVLIFGALLWFSFLKNQFGSYSISGIILSTITLMLIISSIMILWSKKGFKKSAQMSSLIIKFAMFTALLSVIFI